MYLDGLSVLLIGRRLAGLWAAATFADLGASVSALESRNDDTALRGRDDLLGELLATSVGSVAGPDIVDALQTGPHVVLCDRVEGAVPGLPRSVADYLDRVRDLNKTAWVTISAFGLSGSRADDFETDFTLAAAAGVLAYVLSARGDHPMALPGRQVLLAAGQAAVLAGLHAIDRQRATGLPVHADVSALEAMAATGPVLQMGEQLLNLPKGGVVQRFGAPYGWFTCSDGMIYICVGENHQWAGATRAIGAPDWAAALDTHAKRGENKSRIDELVSAWTAIRTRAECERLLQAEGVPAASLNSIEEVRSLSQFSFRHSWRPMTIRSQTVEVMSSPFRLVPNDLGPRSSSAPSESRLGKLRVLEASHVLAASVAGSVLGAMGAHVTKLEPTGRLDIYRRTGPFIDGHADEDWSGFFAMANHSKGSRIVESSAEVPNLIREADVVLENWGKNRARQYGLDCASVAQIQPNALAVSCSGFGQSGPLSHYRMYAYNLNACSGLIDAMRRADDPPPPLDFAWADFISGYALATAIAAWAVGGEQGPHNGGSIDLAMAEVVVHRLNDFVVRCALTGAAREDRCGAPSNELIDVPGDKSQVAVSLRNDADRLVMDAAVNANGAGGNMPTSASIVEHLRRAGVPSAEVLDARGVTENPVLAERGFFVPVEHPEWGTRRLIGLPWRFVGSQPFRLGPPPRLGRNQPKPTGE